MPPSSNEHLKGSLATPEDRARIAARMRELREITGRTQEEVARDALQIGQPTYSKYESNDVAFRRSDLLALAAYYFPDLKPRTALKIAFPELDAEAKDA